MGRAALVTGLVVGVILVVATIAVTRAHRATGRVLELLEGPPR